MTTAILTILAVALFYGVAYVGDQVARLSATVSCHCGRVVSHKVIVVDELDRTHAAQALSEGCAVCRASKHSTDAGKED